MKTVLNSKFKWFVALSLGVMLTAFGQKKTKEYTERFSVNDDVTIDVNTSYTDVEFETWDRDEVRVEARIEVEGISEEEAEKYFENWDFEAVGNSGKVKITAKSGSRSFMVRRENKRGNELFPDDDMDFDFKFDFKMPDIEEDIEKMELEPMIRELTEIAKLPPMLFKNFSEFSFDYEAYKEDGEEYLEKWKKEFKENFDKNFKKDFKVWQEELEERKEELEGRKREMEEQREEVRRRYKEVARERERAVEKRQKAIQEMKREMEKKREANTFFYRVDSKDKNIKVKKTIKIKMPKDAKLKMNVRHGEVKLAENFKNIRATLSHTRLLAATVDGEQTFIEASYSPVIVDRWNMGKLKVNYVKNVAIKNVKNVDLLSTSSDVIIGNITGDAMIKGNFGKLEIENVANTFKALEIILDNTDAVIMLPKSAFDFYCSTSSSKINIPEKLTVNISKTYAGKLIKGYYRQKNSNKNINLTATYSDVVIR